MGPATLYRSRPLSRSGLASGLLLAVLVLAVPLIAAPEPADSDRAELADEIIDLMRQERRDEALPLCRAYTDRFPDDAVMLYNLACLENMTGHAEEAVAAFARAVAAGFDDFGLAFSDPDLASLKYHPDMIDLSMKHQIRLGQLATAQAETLSWQVISGPIPLASDLVGTASGAPEIRLTWTPVGLDIELLATGPWADVLGPDNLAPWNGGSGLVFTLGIPDSNNQHYSTSNFFLFAFGVEKGTALGAIYLASQDRWQALSELVPKVRQDDADNLELRATIPWASILPYNPLVDDQLGFNAALRLTGSGDPQTASLFPDPAAFGPRSKQRRLVPLLFKTVTVSEEVFVGTVSNTISGDEPVTFDLVVISGEEGVGRLAIDFLGGPEQSLLADGQVSEKINLDQGLNWLTRQADFTALKTGAYVIRTELTFPSGRTQTWGSTVLQLAHGWQEEFLARIDLLDPQEKPTAIYYFESIEQGVAAHHPRRGPGTIASTLKELGRLLDNADQEGSIFPDRGSFLAVYPGPSDDTRVCHIYLPSGWKIANKLNPVLTVTAPTGMAGVIADRMGQNYEQGGRMPALRAGPDEGFPVFLVPRLGPVANRRPGELPTDLQAETEACLAWARSTFKADKISMVGVDQGAGPALWLAGTRPKALKAMIIFAGKGLEPWPQADADFIKRQLAGFPVELPVTWMDFVYETEIAGQGPLILDALRGLGSNIVEVQQVRGGLNFTQVADRTVLWAEGLR
jgi:pimeloyl-ACP methyl ester carboxylesterase